MAGDMNIKVGADIADALTKINQLKQANIQLAEETANLSSEYKKNAKELRELEQAQRTGIGVTSTTTARIRGLKEQQQLLTGSIVENKELLKESTAVINSYGKAVATTTTAVKTQGKATATSVKDHDRLGDALKKLGSANEIAAKAVGKLSSIVSLGLHGAVIGLGIAIAGPLIESFAKWIGLSTTVIDYTDQIKASADAAAEKEKEFSAAVDRASSSLIGQADKLTDLRDMLISTSTEIGNLTKATLNQGLARFFFDEKNVAVQKLLTSELKQQIDLRKKAQPFADVPEFHTGKTFAKDPFLRQIEADKQAIKEINVLAGDLGDLFKKIFEEEHKPPKAKIAKAAKEDAKVYTETLQHAINELLKGSMIPEDIGKGSRKKIEGVNIFMTPERIKEWQKATEEEARFNAQLERTEQILTSTLGPAFDALFAAIADGSANAFQSFGEALKRMVVQIIAAIAKAAVLALIMTALVPGSKFGLQFVKFLKFAEGGHVKGPGSGTSDSIPARLSAGEYVLKASTVKKIGVSNLDMLNQGKAPNFFGGIPKFAGGGFVSPSLGNIGGGQNLQIEVFGRLAGNDIYVSNLRTSLTRGRNS